MANYVGGSVVWNLDADLSKFRDGLNQAETEVNRFESRLKSAEQGSQLFLGGVAAITVATAGLVGMSIKAAGEMEMLRSSLDTLTGSADKGAEVFKQLNTFAAETPFETTQLASATQTMLAFGASADSVIPNLQMLGDISMGNAERLQGLTLAFAQVQSTGRLMGQDLLQMINQGFNPLTIIAQQTGKSMADLKDEMADGAISFDMVADAMKTATTEGGLFFQGMQKGAQTLPGLWSTFTDVLAMTARQLVGLSETGEVVEGGLLDVVKNSLADIIDFVTTNQQTILDFFNNSLGWIADNGMIIAGIIAGGITPALYGMASGFLAVMVPLIPFIALGAALGLIAKLIIDRFGGIDNVVKALQPTLDQLSKIFKDNVLPQIQGLWNQISNELIPAFKDLWEVIHPVVLPTLKMLAGILAGTVYVSIMGGIAILRVLITVITSLASVVSTAIVVVPAVFNAMSQGVRNTVQDLINRVTSLFRNLPSALRGALSGLTGALTWPFTDAWNSIKKIVDKIDNHLEKINPFHRESPSLVDNVTSGVDVIKDQYNKLNSISLSPIVTQTASVNQVSPSITSDFGTGSFAPQSREVIVNIDNVNNATDVELIGREVAFKSNML